MYAHVKAISVSTLARVQSGFYEVVRLGDILNQFRGAPGPKFNLWPVTYPLAGTSTTRAVACDAMA